MVWPGVEFHFSSYNIESYVSDVSSRKVNSQNVSFIKIGYVRGSNFILHARILVIHQTNHLVKMVPKMPQTGTHKTQRVYPGSPYSQCRHIVTAFHLHTPEVTDIIM